MQLLFEPTMPSPLLLLILLSSLCINACDCRSLSFNFKVSAVPSLDLGKVSASVTHSIVPGKIQDDQVTEVGADKLSPTLIKPLQKGLKNIVLNNSDQGNKITAEKYSSGNAFEKKKVLEGKAGAVVVKSQVKVSWSAAQVNKRSNKFPGFHVDYVGPRMHPPAHN